MSKDTVKVTGAKGEGFTVPVIKNVVIEGETRIWMEAVLLVPGGGKQHIRERFTGTIRNRGHSRRRKNDS